MKTQFVEAKGCNIAFIEKNKKSEKTIFFLPGNSTSKRCWRKQTGSALFSAYRLIAFDFPANGDSGTADLSLYSLTGLGEIISEAIHKLANDSPYIVAGISMGTNVIAEMLPLILPVGIVLAGTCLFGEKYPIESFVKPNTHVSVVFTDNPREEELKAYATETSLSIDSNDIHTFLEDFKKVKPPFRSTLSSNIGAKVFQDEIALVKNKNIPALVVFGKDEKIIDCNYLDNAGLPLWNDTIYKLEGASHLVNIDQPMLFNQLMAAFAEDMFKE